MIWIVPGAIMTAPTNIAATLFGFGAKSLFQIDAEDANIPNIKF